MTLINSLEEIKIKEVKKHVAIGRDKMSMTIVFDSPVTINEGDIVVYTFTERGFIDGAFIKRNDK